ncbi:MAG: hypothetical protein ACI9E5_000778 [Candidatus Omnitrophota bacterium]|jgi:hypothetical protein
MIRRVSNMKPEEIFTRTVFAFIMIGATFFTWGKWVTCILGVLFLISAMQGFCITCVIYKKFFSKQ